MKRFLLVVSLLCLMLLVGGCKEEEKEFVPGDNELIHLTSTPKGGVETYKIYTTNIMIYVDGTVKIYASDFVRWLGPEDIPEMTITLSPEELEEIKTLIVSEDLYNLRENVGNKDGISGVVKYMTIYSQNGTHTTGGISVSNRQFVRPYEKIESMVREELYIYINEIDELQYKGYVNYQNRNVQLNDREGKLVLDHEYINNVYAYSEEQNGEVLYYTIVEFDSYGGEILKNISVNATPDDLVVLSLNVNNTFVTNVSINKWLDENKLFISQNNMQDAEALTETIQSGLR